MSAESKAKRGESGKTNARSIAFRYGGNPSNLSTRIGSTTHPRLGGSRFLTAMAFGSTLPAFEASYRAYSAADAAMENCTVERPTPSGQPA